MGAPFSLSTGLKPPPRYSPSVEFVARSARRTYSCGSWLGTRAVASLHCTVAPVAACSYSPGSPRSVRLPCASSASSTSPASRLRRSPARLPCRGLGLPFSPISSSRLLTSRTLRPLCLPFRRRNRRMLMARSRYLTNVDVGRPSSANHTAPPTTLAVFTSLRRPFQPSN